MNNFAAQHKPDYGEQRASSKPEAPSSSPYGGSNGSNTELDPDEGFARANFAILSSQAREQLCGNIWLCMHCYFENVSSSTACSMCLRSKSHSDDTKDRGVYTLDNDSFNISRATPYKEICHSYSALVSLDQYQRSLLSRQGHPKYVSINIKGAAERFVAIPPKLMSSHFRNESGKSSSETNSTSLPFEGLLSAFTERSDIWSVSDDFPQVFEMTRNIPQNEPSSDRTVEHSNKDVPLSDLVEYTFLNEEPLINVVVYVLEEFFTDVWQAEYICRTIQRFSKLTMLTAGDWVDNWTPTLLTSLAYVSTFPPRFVSTFHEVVLRETCPKLIPFTSLLSKGGNEGQVDTNNGASTDVCIETVAPSSESDTSGILTSSDASDGYSTEKYLTFWMTSETQVQKQLYHQVRMLERATSTGITAVSRGLALLARFKNAHNTRGLRLLQGLFPQISPASSSLSQTSADSLEVSCTPASPGANVLFNASPSELFGLFKLVLSDHSVSDFRTWISDVVNRVFRVVLGDLLFYYRVCNSFILYSNEKASSQLSSVNLNESDVTSGASRRCTFLFSSTCARRTRLFSFTLEFRQKFSIWVARIVSAMTLRNFAVKSDLVKLIQYYTMSAADFSPESIPSKAEVIQTGLSICQNIIAEVNALVDRSAVDVSELRLASVPSLHTKKIQKERKEESNDGKSRDGLTYWLREVEFLTCELTSFIRFEVDLAEVKHCHVCSVGLPDKSKLEIISEPVLQPKSKLKPTSKSEQGSKKTKSFPEKELFHPSVQHLADSVEDTLDLSFASFLGDTGLFSLPVVEPGLIDAKKSPSQMQSDDKRRHTANQSNTIELYENGLKEQIAVSGNSTENILSSIKDSESPLPTLTKENCPRLATVPFEFLLIQNSKISSFREEPTFHILSSSSSLYSQISDLFYSSVSAKLHRIESITLCMNSRSSRSFLHSLALTRFATYHALHGEKSNNISNHTTDTSLHRFDPFPFGTPRDFIQWMWYDDQSQFNNLDSTLATTTSPLPSQIYPTHSVSVNPLTGQYISVTTPMFRQVQSDDMDNLGNKVKNVGHSRGSLNSMQATHVLTSSEALKTNSPLRPFLPLLLHGFRRDTYRQTHTFGSLGRGIEFYRNASDAVKKTLLSNKTVILTAVSVANLGPGKQGALPPVKADLHHAAVDATVYTPSDSLLFPSSAAAKSIAIFNDYQAIPFAIVNFSILPSSN